MKKSKQYKLDREYNCYSGWYRKGMKKAPIRIDFWRLLVNTIWQFAAWCMALALIVSFVFFGINGLINGDVYRLFVSAAKITWIPYTIYSLYWGFRMADIIIYDKINYKKYIKEREK